MRISDWSSDVCLPISVRETTPGNGHGFRDWWKKAPARRSDGRYGELAPDQDCPNACSDAPEIGRASCRERVSVRVDLGGRRIIKKKKNIYEHESIETEATNNTRTNIER